MKRTVYIETSIPSFLFDERTTPAAIVRRESTRRWWEEERPYYELYTSALVLAELTWNCRHLANVNKQDHLASINGRLGLYVPRVTTPELFFREDLADDE